MVASAGIDFGHMILDSGVFYWGEQRPEEDGRGVIVLHDGGTSEEITPEDIDVRTLVHEYGGGDFAVHDGALFFAWYDDQRVYRQHQERAPRDRSALEQRAASACPRGYERVDDPAALADALVEGTAADEPFVLDVRIDRDEEMAASLRSSFYESVGCRSDGARMALPFPTSERRCDCEALIVSSSAERRWYNWSTPLRPLLVADYPDSDARGRPVLEARVRIEGDPVRADGERVLHEDAAGAEVPVDA